MRELSYVEAAREGLAEEMERDETIFVMGEGIGSRGGNFRTTKGLYDRFGPMRLRDTPITERGFTTLCTGAAMAGARPVVDFMFVDFLLDALGDLILQTSRIQWMSSGRIKMPIVLRGCVGALGSVGAHHSGTYYPFFLHVPGFVVAVPTNPYDAKGLLKTAIRSNDPVVFLEHRVLLSERGPVPETEFTVPFGEAKIINKGTDVSVVAIASMMKKAKIAAAELSDEGISIEIIDLRTLIPLDVETVLRSVRKTGRLLVVDDGFSFCGVGGEIAARVSESGFGILKAPVKRLNGSSVPAPYSPVLENSIVPSTSDIVTAVRQLLSQ